MWEGRFIFLDWEIVLWWIGTELCFLNKSWNEDDIPQYVILNNRLFKKVINSLNLSIRLLLRHIQNKGQYPKWNVTNAFTTVFLSSRHIYGTTFADALGFWLVFYSGHLGDLQKSVPSLKRCSSLLLSDVMVLLLILTFTSFPEKTIWLSPLLIFTGLKPNNWKTNSKNCAISFIIKCFVLSTL